MAKEAEQTQTAAVTLDAVKAIIEESKKPYKDPEAEARKERDRRRIREERARQEKLRQEREAACSHMREDNTSAIAWMQNSDQVTRGVCQRCNALITPSHEEYLRLLRVPTRGLGVVYA